MGYLIEGNTLEWPKSLKYLRIIKILGIKQFMKIYENLDKNKKCNFKYGDEIEYSVLKLDHKNKTVNLSLIADKLINELSKNENFIWHPEYANYMVEGVPSQPFNCSLESLLSVEDNLINRRNEIKNKLGKDDIVTTLSCFPRLGCDGVKPEEQIISQSTLLSDKIISNHVRFPTLTKNIRM